MYEIQRRVFHGHHGCICRLKYPIVMSMILRNAIPVVRVELIYVESSQ